MRGIAGLVMVMGAASLLCGCGKSEEPVMPSTPAAAPEPAETFTPTPAQLKMLAALPAPFNTADPVNGFNKFALCRSCHTITKGGPNLTGPNLYGVYGTKAAMVPGFDFSDAMKNSGFVWTAPQIDKWITDPRAALDGTKMTFAGVKDPKDRADIVAYVALQRDPKS